MLGPLQRDADHARAERELAIARAAVAGILATGDGSAAYFSDVSALL